MKPYQKPYVKMKYLIILLLATLSCSKKVNVPDQSIARLEVQFTSSYCLGMRPTNEILDSLAKLRPFSNGRLICVSSEGKQTTILLNEKGMASLNLARGTYDVYHADKFKQHPEINIPRCDLWKKTVDFTFSLTEKSQLVKGKLHQRCSPCELDQP